LLLPCIYLLSLPHIVCRCLQGTSEGIVLLKKGGTEGYSETRSALHNFLIGDGGIFTVIIDQLAEEGKCSGNYVDANFPRDNWFVRGQAALPECLADTIAWLEKFKKSVSKPETPSGLLAFLGSRRVTVEAHLKPEMKRRGVKPDGTNKDNIAKAIFDHVLEHLDGYVLAVDMGGMSQGAQMGWAPCGYEGDKPDSHRQAAAEVEVVEGGGETGL